MADLENGQGVLPRALQIIEAMPREPIGEQNMGAARELVVRLRATADAIEGNIRFAEDEPARIMGKDGYRGPRSVEAVWGVKPKPEDVPAIPFNMDELMRAKEHGQRLILRVPHDAQGQILNIVRIMEIIAAKTDRSLIQAVGGVAEHFRKDIDLGNAAPRLEWVLATVDSIPGAEHRSYYAQTIALMKYVMLLYTGQQEELTYEDKRVPDDVRDAMREFVLESGELEHLQRVNPKEAARRIAACKLHQLFSPNFVEQYYDTAMVYLDEEGQSPSAGIDRIAIRTRHVFEPAGTLATVRPPLSIGAHPETGVADSDEIARNFGMPFVQRRLA